MDDENSKTCVSQILRATLEAMREKGIMEDVPVFTDLNEFVDHHLSARPPEP